MKQARKVKIGAGAVGGAVVGGVLFGPAWPLGVVAGGAAGAIGTKALAKRHERKAQRKFEKRNVQQQASQSIVARASSTEAAAFA
jgi:Na+/glutamate symporter